MVNIEAEARTGLARQDGELVGATHIVYKLVVDATACHLRLDG
jgi:hypothetical protein